jgi:hypothetical protein
MAATVVSSLLSSESTASTIVCHYCCDFADLASSEPYTMVANFLKQVLQHVSRDRFTEDLDCPIDESIALLPLEIVMQFLGKMLQDYSSIYVILDGIDEVEQSSQHVVLSFVRTIIREHANTKMLVIF